jgi:hypothetical protein
VSQGDTKATTKIATTAANNVLVATVQSNKVQRRVKTVQRGELDLDAKIATKADIVAATTPI